MILSLLVALALAAGFVLGGWIGHAAAERARAPTLESELAEVGELELELADLSVGRKIPCPTCGPGSICDRCSERFRLQEKLARALHALSIAALEQARLRIERGGGLGL